MDIVVSGAEGSEPMSGHFPRPDLVGPVTVPVSGINGPSESNSPGSSICKPGFDTLPGLQIRDAGELDVSSGVEDLKLTVVGVNLESPADVAHVGRTDRSGWRRPCPGTVGRIEDLLQQLRESVVVSRGPAKQLNEFL